MDDLVKNIGQFLENQWLRGANPKDERAKKQDGQSKSAADGRSLLTGTTARSSSTIPTTQANNTPTSFGRSVSRPQLPQGRGVKSHQAKLATSQTTQHLRYHSDRSFVPATAPSRLAGGPRNLGGPNSSNTQQPLVNVIAVRPANTQQPLVNVIAVRPANAVLSTKLSNGIESYPGPKRKAAVELVNPLNKIARNHDWITKRSQVIDLSDDSTPPQMNHIRDKSGVITNGPIIKPNPNVIVLDGSPVISPVRNKAVFQRNPVQLASPTAPSPGSSHSALPKHPMYNNIQNQQKPNTVTKKSKLNAPFQELGSKFKHERTHDAIQHSSGLIPSKHSDGSTRQANMRAKGAGVDGIPKFDSHVSCRVHGVNGLPVTSPINGNEGTVTDWSKLVDNRRAPASPFTPVEEISDTKGESSLAANPQKINDSVQQRRHIQEPDGSESEEDLQTLLRRSNLQKISRKDQQLRDSLNRARVSPITITDSEKADSITAEEGLFVSSKAIMDREHKHGLDVDQRFPPQSVEQDPTPRPPRDTSPLFVSEKNQTRGALPKGNGFMTHRTIQKSAAERSLVKVREFQPRQQQPTLDHNNLLRRFQATQKVPVEATASSGTHTLRQEVKGGRSSSSTTNTSSCDMISGNDIIVANQQDLPGLNDTMDPAKIVIAAGDRSPVPEEQTAHSVTRTEHQPPAAATNQILPGPTIGLQPCVPNAEVANSNATQRQTNSEDAENTSHKQPETSGMSAIQESLQTYFPQVEKPKGMPIMSLHRADKLVNHNRSSIQRAPSSIFIQAQELRRQQEEQCSQHNSAVTLDKAVSTVESSGGANIAEGRVPVRTVVPEQRASQSLPTLTKELVESDNENKFDEGEPVLTRPNAQLVRDSMARCEKMVGSNLFHKLKRNDRLMVALLMDGCKREHITEQLKKLYDHDCAPNSVQRRWAKLREAIPELKALNARNLHCKYRLEEPKLKKEVDDTNSLALHPTTGGKTLTKELRRLYTAALYKDDASIESDTASDESLETEEDMVHYLYSVQRRAVSRNTDVNRNIDEEDWITYSEFESLVNANAAAAKELYNQRGYINFFASGRKFSHTHELNEDGLLHGSMNSEDANIEVQVVRHMRSYHDGVMPKSKEGWLPKRVWDVRETKVVSEETTTTTMTPSSTPIYTTLDAANRAAGSRALQLRRELYPGYAAPSMKNLERFSKDRNAMDDTLNEMERNFESFKETIKGWEDVPEKGKVTPNRRKGRKAGGDITNMREVEVTVEVLERALFGPRNL